MKRNPRLIASLGLPLFAIVLLVLAGTNALAHEGAEHEQAENHDKGDAYVSDGSVELTGEVVDLMCYLDHGATGKDHQQCAGKCIRSNGPVGLLVPADKEGEAPQAYLVIGAHAPINDKLVPLAAQTVTLRGKVVRRSGMRMIENVKIVEK